MLDFNAMAYGFDLNHVDTFGHSDSSDQSHDSPKIRKLRGKINRRRSQLSLTKASAKTEKKGFNKKTHQKK